ncbi:MAG: aspartate aminotransferase family protein [Bacteroidetes bacterium]|nr:aspartate aminotransferase family protein [Bacteroidota bacterium]MCL2303037.1 aspartate aminotransferase family protein [Lentimicrobiaceae bacterium]
MKNSLTNSFYKHIAQTSDAPVAIEVEHAESIYFYNTTGKKYIDLISGIAVCNMGHSHPAIINAVKTQLDKYMHVMVYGELVQQPQVALAEKLCVCLPASLNSVFFVNSGSEAVEGALKLAKRYTGRTELIHFEHAYHGSSHGAMSMMGNETYKAAFQPLLPDTKAIRFGVEEDLQEITEKTAAIIVELIQGEAGVRMASIEYWQKLKQRCEQTNTLLIADEIQTGLGRTGKLFAFEHYNITPDILLLGKAFGGGMPLGAFIADKKMMHVLTHNPVLGHISTFGGHPVCCAAALAHLTLITENKMWQNAETIGKKLEAILWKIPHVKEIRRKGLMIAVDFHDAETNFKTLHSFLEKGIFSDWFLWCDTAMRVAPPLILSDENLKEIENSIFSPVF